MLGESVKHALLGPLNGADLYPHMIEKPSICLFRELDVYVRELN
jgi:hypothetical protein